jgi:glycosyltransferase involved in cell wall biosynthesis
VKSDFPLVSIVTPSFNQAEFIEKTILSVLDQDYPNIEYFVIDGGSTDGSVDIIKNYSKRLSGWISEKDRGQADAINKGFHRAQGEFITWLNSDDLLLAGSISSAVKVLQDNPSVSLVYGDVVSIDESGNVINVMRYGNWELSDLMQFQILGQPSVMMRRACLENAGYLDLKYHYLLDHQLWLRVAERGPILYLPCTRAAARFHPGAKNVAFSKEFGKEALQIVTWMQKQPYLKEKFKQHERKIKAGAYRIAARYLLDADLYSASLSYYRKSLFSYPPIALKELHRMVYALLSLLGLKSTRNIYYRLKRDQYKNYKL